MDDEARRLKGLIETNTLVLEELARLEDPSLRELIRELERARADAEIQLGQLRGELQERNISTARDEPQNPRSDLPAHVAGREGQRERSWSDLRLFEQNHNP